MGHGVEHCSLWCSALLDDLCTELLGSAVPTLTVKPTAMLKGHVRPAHTQEVSHMQQHCKDYCLGLGTRALILHGSQGELKLFSPCSHSLLPHPFCTYHPLDSVFFNLAYSTMFLDQGLTIEQVYYNFFNVYSELG